MNQKKIVIFGSYVADLTGKSDHLPTVGETVFGEYFKIGPGGKGSNQAVAASRAGANIQLITKIAHDTFGEMALSFYEENGMSTEGVLFDIDHGTGIALICVDENTGQNQILVVPGACMNIQPEDICRMEKMLESADILLVQFEVNMDALECVIDIARERGALIILNPAPARKVSDSLLEKIDIITPNEVEAETLTGIHVTDAVSAEKAAHIFHKQGIANVVITLGENGVFVSDGISFKLVPARDVNVVDTTGAGDAFNGGFVTALSEGSDIFRAAEFGNVLASLSIQRFGTAPSMPLRYEIDAIL